MCDCGINDLVSYEAMNIHFREETNFHSFNLFMRHLLKIKTFVYTINKPLNNQKLSNHLFSENEVPPLSPDNVQACGGQG